MSRFDPARVDFSPYGFTCVRWQAECMSQSDRHNEIELNYLPSGTLDYMHGGNKISLSAGQLTAFWAALPHQVLSFSGVSEYFVITIPLVWFLGRSFPLAFCKALLRGEMLSETCTARPQEMAMQQNLDIGKFSCWIKDFASGDAALLKAARLEIHARLERLATCYSSPGTTTKGSRPSTLHPAELTKAEQMAAYIALENTQPLTVADVSHAVGLHSSHAMSIFSKTFGLSIMEFVRQHRLAQAQSMLVATDEPILTIALSAGFQSVSQFYAVFKQYCHCSPREYRKQHRE